MMMMTIVTIITLQSMSWKIQVRSRSSPDCTWPESTSDGRPPHPKVPDPLDSVHKYSSAIHNALGSLNAPPPDSPVSPLLSHNSALLIIM